MVTTWPKNFPGLGTAAERLAKRITVASEGKITVKVFAAGELVPAFESFDAVSQGTAEIYHAADYYWQGKSKGFNFFCTVPFGMTATELNAWIYHNGGQELWDDLSGQFNVKAFLCANTGVQMGGWFANQVNTLDDFKGLKFRMPGIGGEVLRRLGAAVVNLPGGEIFPALQSGAIDGTEWVGPWNDLAFGFYKIVKNYYFPGFHEPGTALSAGFNRQKWEGLSTSEQQLIASACGRRERCRPGRVQRPQRRLPRSAGPKARRPGSPVLEPTAESDRQACRRSGCRGRHQRCDDEEDLRELPEVPQGVDRLVQAGRPGVLERPPAALQVRIAVSGAAQPATATRNPHQAPWCGFSPPSKQRDMPSAVR